MPNPIGDPLDIAEKLKKAKQDAEERKRAAAFSASSGVAVGPIAPTSSIAPARAPIDLGKVMGDVAVKPNFPKGQEEDYYKALYDQAVQDLVDKGYKYTPTGNATSGQTLQFEKWNPKKPIYDDYGKVVRYTAGWEEVGPGTDPLADRAQELWWNYQNAGLVKSGLGKTAASGASSARLEPDATSEMERRLDDFIRRVDFLYDLEERQRDFQMDRQDYATQAQAANLAVSKSEMAGDSFGGDNFWYNPMLPASMRGIEDYTQMAEAGIPDYMPADYQRSANGMLPSGFNDEDYNNWGQPDYMGFANGTVIPAYSGGTTSPNPAPGTLPTNNLVPNYAAQGGGQAWDAAVLQAALMKIASNTNAGKPAGLPPALASMWDAVSGAGFNSDGVPLLPQGFVYMLAEHIQNSPQAWQYTYGERPPDNPNYYTQPPLSPSEQIAQQNADLSAARYELEMQKYLDSVSGQYQGGAASGYSAGRPSSGGSSTGYESMYGAASALQQGDPDLPAKLALEREKLAQDRELALLQLDQSAQSMQIDAAYKAALAADINNRFELGLQELQFREDSFMLGFDLDERQFQEALRRAQFEEQITGRRLTLEEAVFDLQKASTLAEIEDMYRRGQLEQSQFEELLRRNGIDEEFRRVDQGFRQTELQQNQQVIEQNAYQFEQTQALDRERFMADLQLRMQSGQLDQSKFEETIRQFDASQSQQAQQFAATFGLQEDEMRQRAYEFEQSHALDQARFEHEKQLQEEANQLERARTTTEFLANPGNAVAAHFYQSMTSPDQEPVGTARDLFTGQVTGQRTFSQTQRENAPIYQQSQNQSTVAGAQVNPNPQQMGQPQDQPQAIAYEGPPYDPNAPRPGGIRRPEYAGGTYGYTTAPYFIVGDSANGRTTGHEELVENPTQAPIKVKPNKVVKKMGLQPAGRRR